MLLTKPPQLDPSWKSALEDEWEKPYMEALVSFLKKEREEHEVYPCKNLVFNALNHVGFDDVSVVIMGQDPYHGPGQAHGLSFSVPRGIKPPPSLQNIFKELKDDLGIPIPASGNLEPWAKQGVLLLNAVLTVRAREPQSHAKRGWEAFTDAVIERLIDREDPVIFVLWGKSAQEKCRHLLGLSTKRHFILTAPHPSPYSADRGFFGCKHFSKINDLLKTVGKSPIEWRLNG